MNSMKKGTLSILVCMLMMVTAIVPISVTALPEKMTHPLVKGNTLYVGGLGPNNYTKIQDAIDNASNGDTVFVFDDSSPYQENIIVDKSLNLLGENKTTTIIEGGDLSDCVVLYAEGVTLQGFTLRHASGKDYGVRIGSSHNIVRGNIMTNNMIGIYLRGVDSNVIEGNTVTQNAYGGIYQYACDDTAISNNTISGATYYGGICIFYESHRALISFNTVSDNINGIAIAQSNDNTIAHNSIVGNRFGVSLDMASNNLISQNNIQKNQKPVLLNGLSWHLAKARWFRNTFDENYWGQSTVLFKPILGVLLLVYHVQDFGSMGIGFQIFGILPIIKFDYHPAQQPYDIPGMG